jgi:hypothetical protein
MKDFYYILGLDINCSAVEIGLAYRKLSEKFRPDINQHDTYFENRYREINEAFDVLSDPVRRSKYDAELKKYKAHQAVPVKKKPQAKTKWVDVVFTLTLIAITVIFGRYVLQSITGSKTKKVSAAPMVVAAAPVYTAKPHKKKRKFTARYVAHTKPVVSATPVKAPVLPVAVPEPTYQFKSDKPVITAINHKSVVGNAVVSDNADASADPGYLFTTYLKANETGVINLREYDSYSASVIRVLPNNTKVYVLEKAGSYYKVAYNGLVGYVPNWTVNER